MGKLNFTTADINEILDRANVALDKANATKEELAAILFGIAGGLRINEHAMTKGGMQEYFEALFGNQDVLLDAYSNVCDDAKPWNAFWEFAKDKKTVADWTKLHAGGGGSVDLDNLQKRVESSNLFESDTIDPTETGYVNAIAPWKLDLANFLSGVKGGAKHCSMVVAYLPILPTIVNGGNTEQYLFKPDSGFVKMDGGSLTEEVFGTPDDGKITYTCHITAYSSSGATIVWIPSTYCIKSTGGNSLEIKSTDHVELGRFDGVDALDIQPGWQIVVPSSITDINKRFKVRCHGSNPFAKSSSLSHYSLVQYVVARSTPSLSSSNGGTKILDCGVSYLEVSQDTAVQLFGPGGDSRESNWDLVIRNVDGNHAIALYWIPVAP